VGAVERLLCDLDIPAGATVASATVLDGKPGERLLLRYDVVAGPARRRCATVFGKVYADPTAAARVHETMRQLWEAFAGCDQPTTVPRPVALVPELDMVVYVPAPGDPLDTLLDAPEAPAALRLAGAWLSHLHSAPLPLGRRFILATELLNASAWGTLVAAAAPEVASTATGLCLRLRDRSTAVALEEATAIHKDFHPGHVIVNGSVAVVDFDETRLGDPAFDVAHFCAYLHLVALRRGLAARQAELEHAFIEGYADRSGWEADERFSFFRAYTAVKIAKQLATERGLRPRPYGDELARQLRAVLVEGMRWVEAGA
jgi:aminoglycoside phosphotransferase (APT) family kinase protein